MSVASWLITVPPQTLESLTEAMVTGAASRLRRSEVRFGCLDRSVRLSPGRTDIMTT